MHHAFGGDVVACRRSCSPRARCSPAGSWCPTLRELARQQPPAFPQDQFLKALADQVALLGDARSDTFELRQLERAGRVHGIELPSATHREQPREPLNLPRPGRNDPCPCGSGQKYKRCHGR